MTLTKVELRVLIRQSILEAIEEETIDKLNKLGFYGPDELPTDHGEFVTPISDTD